VAELVVLLPLLRIGQDGIGLGYLLELLLRTGLLSGPDGTSWPACDKLP